MDQTGVQSTQCANVDASAGAFDDPAIFMIYLSSIVYF
jgi:hypothetical protein